MIDMMTIYIPKGETAHYDKLYTDRLVVDGCLHVERTLDARIICGKGSIHAGKVSANTIRIGSLDACLIMCGQLLAGRVDAPEVYASKRIAVSGFLSALTAKAPKLIAAMYSVEQLEVKDLTEVPSKGLSTFMLLLMSRVQTIRLALAAFFTHGGAVDADYETLEPKKDERLKTPGPVDEELNRVVNLFKLCRDCGYTLRVIPGTPEENAPVFDFDAAWHQSKAA